MNPYRDFTVDDERLRHAAAVDLERRNIGRWRDALIVVTAVAGIVSWIHLPGLVFVNLGAGVLALGCSIEHHRLKREVRHLLKPVAASPPPRAPR